MVVASLLLIAVILFVAYWKKRKKNFGEEASVYCEKKGVSDDTAELPKIPDDISLLDDFCVEEDITYIHTYENIE